MALSMHFGPRFSGRISFFRGYKHLPRSNRSKGYWQMLFSSTERDMAESHTHKHTRKWKVGRKDGVCVCIHEHKINSTVMLH